MKTEKWARWSLYILLALGIASKGYGSYLLSLTSDHVTPGILFFEMTLEKNPLLKGMYLPFNNLLFTDFPLYVLNGAIFGMSAFTLKLSALIIFSITVLLAYRLVSVSYDKTTASICAVALLCSSQTSSNISIQPFIHIGTVGAALFSALMTISARQLSDAGNRKWMHYMALVSLASVLGTFSDIYYVAAFSAPLIAASMAIIMFNRKGFFQGREIYIIITVAISSAAGVMLLGHSYDLLDINMVKTHTSVLSDRLANHLKFFVINLLRLYDLSAFAQRSFSPSMIVALLKCFFSALVIRFFLKRLIVALRERDLTFLYFLFLGLGISFAFILREGMSDLNLSRYLIALTYVTAFYISLAVRDSMAAGGKRTAAVMLMLFIAISAYNSLSSLAKPRYSHTKEELVERLAGAGLAYGYADFWDSNIITFLSSNEIRVRPAGFGRGEIQPNLWVSNSKWYGPSAYSGPTFLLVENGNTASTLSDLNARFLESKFGRPAETLHMDGYTVFVWGYNISPTRLPFIDISQMRRSNASYELVQGEGYILTTSAGASSSMMSTEMFTFPAGPKSAVFALRAAAGCDAGADLRVIGTNMADYSSKYYSKEIRLDAHAGWNEYEVGFLSEKGFVYQVSVVPSGECNISIKSIWFQ